MHTKPEPLKTLSLRSFLVKPILRKHSRCNGHRNKSDKCIAAAPSFNLPIGYYKHLRKNPKLKETPSRLGDKSHVPFHFIFIVVVIIIIIIPCLKVRCPRSPVGETGTL